jgi:DNA-binding NtrC family response regulator
MPEQSLIPSGFPDNRARVLVVDDEQIIVKRLKTLLEGLGYTVSAFTDSEAAIKKIEAEDFDLVITDLKMRKNDGLKILESARKKDEDIRVIIITGLNNWECLAETVNKGASACISKPFKIEDLQQAIDRALPPCRLAAPRTAPVS